jgi:hypothetical protein
METVEEKGANNIQSRTQLVRYCTEFKEEEEKENENRSAITD